MSSGGMLAQFAAAGVLDELCLSTAPLINAGAAARIMNGPAIGVPEHFRLALLLEEDGFLFSRYLRGDRP